MIILQKPFNPLELIARVRSQIRRYTSFGTMQQAKESEIYRSGGLWIDNDKKIVMVDDEEVKLTPIDYKILLLLSKMQEKYSQLKKFMRQSGRNKPLQRIIR